MTDRLSTGEGNGSDKEYGLPQRPRETEVGHLSGQNRGFSFHPRLLHDIYHHRIGEIGVRALGVLAVLVLPNIPFLDINAVGAETPQTKSTPKPEFNLKGGMASQQKQVIDNYEIDFAKTNTAGTEIVTVVRKPREKTERIAKLSTDPKSGDLVLDEVCKTSYDLQDAAISETDPNKIVGVGIDSSGVWPNRNDQGVVILTRDNGQSCQIFNNDPLLARGPLFNVFYANGTDIFISQGDKLLSDYPAFFLYFNADTGVFQDLGICTGCAGGGMPRSIAALSTELENYIGYITADPHLGYIRKIFNITGIISRIELRPQVFYVQGEPVQYIDSQGFHNVLVYNNFEHDPVTDRALGTMYWDKYRWEGLNFTFLDGTRIQTSASLYPSSSKDGIGISRVAADKETGIAYMATSVQSKNTQTWNNIAHAYFENAATHQLLPTNGDWLFPNPNKGWVDINAAGIISKNGNKFLLAGLVNSNWVYDSVTNTESLSFQDGRFVSSNLLNQNPWKAINLSASNDLIFLPYISRRLSFSKPLIWT